MMKHPYCLLMAALLIGCSREDSKMPVVITADITEIKQTSAQCGGYVISEGNDSVIARGVCWSEQASPTLSDFFSSDGSDTGRYVSYITGLTNNRLYYVRSYATNLSGTSYGETRSFRSGTVTDADGNLYSTVLIGTQLWMAQNLRTTKYSDGTPVQYVSDNKWSTLATGAFCWQDNDMSYKNTYGALYNFFTVEESKNICPKGWHVPSPAEWNQLITFLGGSAVAGGAMKEIGIIHWISPNNGASNSAGFTALPGGVRAVNFDQFGYVGWWWSSSQNPGTAYAHGITITNTGTDCSAVQFLKTYGVSIRCLKN